MAAEDRGAKYDVVNRAWSVVDTALDLTGGSGIFKRSRFEQLFRDARLGRIHPANPLLTHELVGKMSLGHQPRRSAPLGLTGFGGNSVDTRCCG